MCEAAESIHRVYDGDDDFIDVQEDRSCKVAMANRIMLPNGNSGSSEWKSLGRLLWV